MRLKEVKVHQYKSIEKEQEFNIESDITILVGMNESGKTAILQSIAKTNYFQHDSKFLFDKTLDFPRRFKKKSDKSGVIEKAITCIYDLDEDLIGEIETDIGSKMFTPDAVSVTTKYNNKSSWGIGAVDKKKFIEQKTKELSISSATMTTKLLEVNSESDFDELLAEYTDEKYTEGLEQLRKYFKNEWNWDSDCISEYITRTHLRPNLPKFLYYDEYYALPSRISIEKLEEDDLNEEELKTAKALLELADLNAGEITGSSNFENFVAELEATEAAITDELFEYWSTNKNLNIEFKIEPVEKTVEVKSKDRYNKDEIVETTIVEHILDIRVKNSRTRVSLPLKNRSKGFNWFFSFLVWFKKIQEDSNSKYIILLDEPGLNLHASAQGDLLRFLEDLSVDYQIVYSTHSPFMISSESLSRVRTVLETEDGTKVSDSIQEKDPNTLFPLQAALGYDIAQNLFISDKNLLVEGVSDLVILQAISSMLEAAQKTCLRDDITIVPTGGLEKVATFISLLRGSKLEVRCLLDSYTDQKGKAKMDKLIREKLIHQKFVKFYDEFCDNQKADLEDVFSKEDYVKLFNAAFPEHTDFEVAALNTSKERIIEQINEQINKDRFNHYRPANHIASSGYDIKEFDDKTIDRFEKLFEKINSLFE